MNPSSRASVLILRFGLIFVVTWFAIAQLLGPARWIGFVPDFLPSLLGVSAQTLVYANAVFELVAALFLVVNRYTPVVSALLGIHLVFIAAGIGNTALGVRDLGLAIMCFALATAEPERWRRTPNTDTASTTP